MHEYDNIFYVYAYLDPRKPGSFRYGTHMFGYETFYIGKGFADRYLSHLYVDNKGSNYNKYKTNKIRKLFRLGFDVKCYVVRVKINLSENDAFDLEKEMIKIIGRMDQKLGPLTNMTDGGEGASGVVYTESRRRQLSEKSKGNKYALGHHHTPETLIRMSNSLKGHKVHQSQRLASSIANKGKIVSLLSRQKMSKSHKGKKLSTSHINKLREVRKGKKLSGEAYVNSIITRQKLTEEKFIELLNLFNTGKYTDKELAKMFGVNRSTVSIKLKKFRSFTKPSKFSKEQISEIINRKFIMHQSSEEIAKHFQLSKKQIINLFRHKTKCLGDKN